MNARAHVLGGLALSLPILGLHPLLLIPAALGSLWPDLDHPTSTLGRYVPWPRVSQSRGPQVPPRVGRWSWPHPWWHRHQAHSLGFLLISLGLGALFIHFAPHWPWALIALSFSLGFLSHLFLDGFNQEKQWWLWPVTARGFRWPLHGRVRTINTAVTLVLTFAVLGEGLWMVHSSSHSLAALSPYLSHIVAALPH